MHIYISTDPQPIVLECITKDEASNGEGMGKNGLQDTYGRTRNGALSRRCPVLECISREVVLRGAQPWKCCRSGTT